MRVTCPCCATDFPLEADMLDADGKRVAAQLAGMDGTLRQGVNGHLRTFKPDNTARQRGASNTVAEPEVFVRASSVCHDNREGVHRRAAIARRIAMAEQQPLLDLRSAR